MSKRVTIIAVSCIAAILGVTAIVGCDKVNDVLSRVGLTDGEIVEGLKTALVSSADTSTASASKVNGFLLNELIKIAAPPEVVQLQGFLEEHSSNPLFKGASDVLSSAVGNLVTSINRAAEDGAKKAYPIFENAITSMTITDGLTILQGGKTSATDYLRRKTYTDLVTAFAEPVKNVVDRGDVSKYWGDIAPQYNKYAPLAKVVGYTGPASVNPDLSEYVTERAMDGLFKLVAKEEAAIRENPKKYASNIIQKVFGSVEARAALNK